MYTEAISWFRGQMVVSPGYNPINTSVTILNATLYVLCSNGVIKSLANERSQRVPKTDRLARVYINGRDTVRVIVCAYNVILLRSTGDEVYRFFFGYYDAS